MKGALKKLCRVVQDHEKIVVVGSGPSAELITPELLEDAAIITVNHAAVFIEPTIQVAIDSWGIEPVLRLRPEWKSLPCLWVWKPATLSHAPEAEKLINDKFISMSDIWEKDTEERLRGSGVTAVWLGWLLARELRKQLVTIGIDMGLLYLPQDPIRYAPSMYPEKFQAVHAETRRGNVPVDHKRQGEFIPNAYPGQRDMLVHLAGVHEVDKWRPETINMSCVNWTRLTDGVDAAVDQGIVQSILEKIG